MKLLSRRVNAEHGEIFIRCDANQLCFPIGLIRQRHLSGTGILNHVKISDDVAIRIPHKPRTSTLGNLIQVQGEEILLDADRGNIDDGGRCLSEQSDGGFFIG
jgi:hypothetical protein